MLAAGCFAALATVAASLSGCEGAPPEPREIAAEGEAAVVQGDESSSVVAVRGGAWVSMSEIEAPIRLPLHDLAMQRFRLLRQSLLSVATEGFDDSEAAAPATQLSLEPPTPPRLAIEADPDRTRPSATVPVSVLVFCNFESPHCARLQITLSDVSSLYPEVLAVSAFDLPLPFHRGAPRAAEAARCALEQGNFWRFHDLLYAGSGPLDDQRLERAARAALLDVDSFDACLGSGRHAEYVAADAALAARLGIATVPAVFVNGLYASPEVEPSDLIWLIEQELARLDVPSPRLVTPMRRTTAPLTLRALLPSRYSGQGVAVLSTVVEPERLLIVGEGHRLSPSLLVERITLDGVELVNAGMPELLGVDANDDQGGAEDDRSPPIAASGEPLIITPHRAVPVTLDRGEVLVRLSNRNALQDVLQTVPMTAGGYRQLRISEVKPGSLYELLGLESGDVLLGVNEQPVHEADNPLWDALETEDEVRVRVMRRGGVPQHYTYRFDD